MTALRHVAVDAVASTLWWTGRSHPVRRADGLLSIVTFHRVLPSEERHDYPHPELAVTPDGLREMLTYLAEHYSIDVVSRSWAALAAGEPSPKPRLSLTFDDGQWDNLAHAGPVLAELGVAATFYVPVEAVERGSSLWHDELGFAARHLERTGRQDELRALATEFGLPSTGTTEAVKALSPEARRAFLDALLGATGPVDPPWARMMTWDELRALHGAGHEIGSHSISHPLLVQLDDDELETELVQSKRTLERELSTTITSFAYPNGDHDDRVTAATKAAGYENAVTTTWGRNRPDADPMRLARCHIDLDHFVDRRGRCSRARTAMRLGGLQPGLA